MHMQKTWTSGSAIRPNDTPVLFETLGNPRLAEVAKNRKSNAWILTHMNKQSTVTCRHCTNLAEGTAGVKLAGRAERATAAKLEALEPRAYGEVCTGATSKRVSQKESGCAQ